jgi:hypothetical protein
LSESDALASHFEDVAKDILQRKVIPFLGAGASLCDRDETTAWKPGNSDFLPSSRELTYFLARQYRYPKKETKELTRVAQYAVVKKGLGSLYETLQGIFGKPYQPTSLHRFLARLPALLRRRGQKLPEHPYRQRLVMVTTNYDDLLERAFDDEGEPYHKLVYIANETSVEGSLIPRGSFLHWTPDKQRPHLIAVDKANEYSLLDQYEESIHPQRTPVVKHPVIISIHGAVDRIPAQDRGDPTPKNSSYVITEDHYIDYLLRSDISKFLPGSVVAALKRNHYLFLGYSLRDWNLRVMLRRIWREETLELKSWAVQKPVGSLDEEYWHAKGVKLIDMDLGEYIKELSSYL